MAMVARCVSLRSARISPMNWNGAPTKHEPRPSLHIRIRKASPAVAVAVATRRVAVEKHCTAGRLRRFFHQVLRFTPESRVHRGFFWPAHAGEHCRRDVAKALGCGELVTAPDTVSFCVWLAAHHQDNFVKHWLRPFASVAIATRTLPSLRIVALSAGGKAFGRLVEAREPIQI